MKGRFVLGFCFILFSFSFAFAASCDDDQTIMRLYSDSNSHVSAWDQNVGTYVNEICYDDIFGYTYSGVNPHDCGGSNGVLSLTGDSNAHASETSDVNYDYEVCYGNLACAYDDSAGSECDGGGEVVARMYSTSNSHVSDASNGNYSIKICCDSVGVYWSDMNGNKITGADFGDSVKLVARGAASGTFDIKEKDPLFSDNIRSVVGEGVGSDLVGIWTIEDEDLAKTPGDYDEFYFDVDGGQKSEYLAIDPNGDDDPMDISIISPLCGEYFDEGVGVEIVIVASDPDDLITGTVAVDGMKKNFTNGGISFAKSLDTPGNLQIVVEASNSRGERTRAISNIMILDMENGTYVDGKYVAACISKPKDFTDIPGSIVEFDASSTRGVSIVAGVLKELVPGLDRFSWYWTFYPEEVTRNLVNTTDRFAFEFTAEFPIAGDNSASLRVEV